LIGKQKRNRVVIVSALEQTKVVDWKDTDIAKTKAPSSSHSEDKNKNVNKTARHNGTQVGFGQKGFGTNTDTFFLLQG
jgi:hypothetical protein